MDFEKQTISAKGVRSLVWRDDCLIDWVGGGAQYRLDGSVKPSFINYTFRFDAAVASPSGRYAVIFERFGTKGLILDNGSVIREINRSFYQANAYEFPVALFAMPDGAEGVAHCPQRYCRLEIEELSGKALTERSTKPMDFFHSRVEVDRASKYLVSAGWIWHPFSTALVWNLESVLSDPSILDSRDDCVVDDQLVEIEDVCFTGTGNMVIVANKDSVDLIDDETPEIEGPRRRTNTIAMFDMNQRRYLSVTPLEHDVGTVMALDDEHVIGFYDHPHLISTSTGRTLYEWTELKSGQQACSIHWGRPLPPIALDPANKRFAVADENGITVVSNIRP